MIYFCINFRRIFEVKCSENGRIKLTKWDQPQNAFYVVERMKINVGNEKSHEVYFYYK